MFKKKSWTKQKPKKKNAKSNKWMNRESFRHWEYNEIFRKVWACDQLKNQQQQLTIFHRQCGMKRQQQNRD